MAAGSGDSFQVLFNSAMPFPSYCNERATSVACDRCGYAELSPIDSGFEYHSTIKLRGLFFKKQRLERERETGY